MTLRFFNIHNTVQLTTSLLTRSHRMTWSETGEKETPFYQIIFQSLSNEPC